MSCIVLLVLGSACGVSVDKLLEGKQATTDRVYLAAQPTEVTIAQGAEATVTLTATRSAGFHGDVQLTTTDVPLGVTAPATIPAGSTSGQVTTTAVTFQVAPTMAVGTYMPRVISHAAALPDTFVTILLNVAPQPAFVVTPAVTSVPITLGGRAPLRLAIARTNFAAPITFSLTGAAGIAATGTSASSDTTTATISVASNVAPGTYPVVLHCTATGIAERTVPLTVTVSDQVQIVAPAEATVSPNGSVAVSLIVNRGTYTGPLTYSGGNLPAGVDLIADLADGNGSITVTFRASAATAQGAYAVTIRAAGNGGQVATTQLSLKVDAPPISVSLEPSTVSLLPGSSAATTLILTRVAYSGSVSISIDDAPGGVTATAQPATLSGNTSTIAVTASSTVTPGQYSLTVRATPSGLPVGAVRTSSLTIIVRASSPGTGNVIVNAATCSRPDWFAFQDGTSVWTQVLPTGNRFQFTVNSSTGSFAYHDSSGVTVRYMTKGELTAAPINSCPPPKGTKTIIGRGNHATGNGSAPPGEFNYSLGGATAQSTALGPQFSLTNVKDGPQDLVVVSTLNGVPQGGALIQRDLNLPDGGDLGPISVSNGAGSFTMASAAVTIPGLSIDMPHSMSYLTTPACIVNPLYATSVGSTSRGIPADVQRATDFHLLKVFTNTQVSGALVRRSTGLTFHSFGSQTLTLPPSVATPTVTPIDGRTKRLSVFLPELPGVYGDSVTFQFSYGPTKMTVWATSAVLGAANATLAMPDLTGVSGWPASAEIPATAPIGWSLTLDGSSATESLCTEGHRTVQLTAVSTG